MVDLGETHVCPEISRDQVIAIQLVRYADKEWIRNGLKIVNNIK